MLLLPAGAAAGSTFLAQCIIVVIPRLSVWMLVDLMLELILFVNDCVLFKFGS